MMELGCIRQWISVVCWAAILISVCISTAFGYHLCYECSDKSAMCRHQVYDGQYLTTTECASPCFLRKEGKRTYRGCFDGWVGGMVDRSYLGCRKQKYFGESVEWCFCQSDDDHSSQPCNGASRDVISAEYNTEVLHDRKQQTNRKQEEGNRKQDNTIYSPYRPFGYNVSSVRKASKLLTGRDFIKNKDPPKKVETTLPKETKPTRMQRYSNPYDRLTCYSCHNAMAQCGTEINMEEHYVARQLCDTKCYLRKEQHKLYRGCFDGWQTTQVQSNYTGCDVQRQPSGREVQWCFCTSNLCNGKSVEHLTKPLLNAPQKQPHLHVAPNKRRYKPYPVIVAPVHIPRVSIKEPYHPQVVDFKVEEEEDDDVKAQHIVHHFYGQPTARVGKPYSVLKTSVEGFSESVAAESTSIVGMCHGQRDGIYPDPYDCERFIQCYHGYTYRRMCPPGTVWNHRYGHCGHHDEYTSDRCGGGNEAGNDAERPGTTRRKWEQRGGTGNIAEKLGNNDRQVVLDDKLTRLVEEALNSDD